MRRQRGFTLVEIIIAVFILLLLLTLAVPSLNGVLADKRLHRSLDRFNELVRQAHERSLAEHRAYLIVWNDVQISLQPAAFLKTEPHESIDTMPIARQEKWRLELPAALSKKVPAESCRRRYRKRCQRSGSFGSRAYASQPESVLPAMMAAGRQSIRH